MSILVTGGAGYIGSHTCISLMKAGYDVVVLDNFSNSNPESLKRVIDITGKQFPVHHVDLLDRPSVETVFASADIEAVVHFAGLKAVGESVAQPLRYYHNNITSTLVLCETMQKFGVKRLVFSSSATVYGMQTQMPLTEDMPLSAINPYGRTKMMLEMILADLVAANPDWSISLLRYFNPVGAHESGSIGEEPNGIPNNLFPYITQVATGRLRQLTIHGNDYPTPDGTGIRDYIHVMDLAEGHVKAPHYMLSTTGLEAFNLGTGEGYSVLDVIAAFEQATGVNVPHQFGPRRPGDTAVSYADATKATQVLGWRAKHTLVEMCADAWRWQSQNRNGYNA